MEDIMDITFYLKGLDCANCAAKIENAIKDCDFSKNATLNFVAQKLTVTSDLNDIDLITSKVRRIVAHYEPEVDVVIADNKSKKQETSLIPQMIKIIISALLFALGLIVSLCFDNNITTKTISYILYGVSYISVATPVIVATVKALVSKNLFNENTLMFIASIGAIAIGEVHEAIAVMLFYSVGELFQSIAVGKSRRSIASLIGTKPETADMLIDGEYKTVSPYDVPAGSEIRVKVGEKIPLDGIVINGTTQINNSAITGESIPIDISENDEVKAGGINLSGVITVKTTFAFTDSTVYKMLKLVEEATEKKTKTENFISVFAKYYTPIVVLLALLISVIPPLFTGMDFSSWIQRGLIFLVVSCPCALVISIPMGYFAGIGKASSESILIKGSNYLEAISKAKTVVLDKTGTITNGEFEISSINPKNISEEELLCYAAYCEYNSTHPIALSVKKRYSGKIQIDKIENHIEIAGKGIKTVINGNEYLCGNEKFLKENGIATEKSNGTSLFLAENGRYLGYIEIADTPKETSAKAIEFLKSKGIQAIMLTGDNEASAKHTAELTGISEYHHSLLPEDKSRILSDKKSLLKKDEKIIFIGDGINDAPVLAAADIGIAMGKNGTDSAIETADVVFMKDDLTQLETAYNISCKTRRIILQNIIAAISIKIVIQILSVIGFANMWIAVFADVGVSILAILNSLRILKGQHKHRLDNT
ncbi:MAG: cadmium-translocating P-type ATPase [Ruminococcaceae bacterium]|nr:cadmium-translocating P-type ATPase [Oscillospiraceae bacterium]